MLGDIRELLEQMLAEIKHLRHDIQELKHVMKYEARIR